MGLYKNKKLKDREHEKVFTADAGCMDRYRFVV